MSRAHAAHTDETDPDDVDGLYRELGSGSALRLRLRRSGQAQSCEGGADSDCGSGFEKITAVWNQAFIVHLSPP